MKLQFQSLEDWLKESKIQNEPTYGCVMLYADMPNWEEDHLEGIEEKDIYIKPYNDSNGLEEEPHVTLVYGIHEDEIDPQVVYDVMEQNLHPVKVKIEEIGFFETPDCDVVKYDVPITSELKKYRNLFMKFPNTQEYPNYKPHMTIAYVKKGTGKNYAKKLEEPLIVMLNKGVYSWHEKKDGKVEELKKQYVFPKEETEGLQ
jgi:2'-5' RNA ligase